MSFGADIKGNAGRTGSFTAAGLARGAANNTVKIAATAPAGVHYAIHGIGYYKANADDLTVTALPIQSASTTCLYLIQINAAGDALTTKKGVAVANADLTAGKAVLHWPDPDDNLCPLGGVKVALGATTFTAGTTAFNAANVTSTFYDFIGGLPLKPLTS